MRCSKCGAENPEGLKFCNECAEPFKRRCGTCGFENSGREILWRMRRATKYPDRSRHSQSTGSQGGSRPYRFSNHHGWRAQNRHRAVRGHQGLDGSDGGPRSRGGARDRRSGSHWTAARRTRCPTCLPCIGDFTAAGQPARNETLPDFAVARFGVNLTGMCLMPANCIEASRCTSPASSMSGKRCRSCSKAIRISSRAR